MSPARTRAARAVVCGLVLIWLAASDWADQIDDVYITASFARSLVEAGSLSWPGGAVVEGFSSYTWLAVLAAVEAAGGDVPWWAQVASLLGGLGVVGAASAWLPSDRRGTLVLAGLTAWSPLAYWSGMGMETTAYALCLVVGWPAVAAGRSWGLAVLVLAALTRPEGTGVALLGCLVLRERSEARAAVGALVAFHGARMLGFGGLLSTVAQVKLGGGPFVLGQLPLELALGGPILWLAWPRGSRSDARWVALAPLAVSVAALAAIGGDWMANGRLLLPGLAASAVALARVPTDRQEPGWGWLVALVAVGSIQPRFLVMPEVRWPVLAPWSVYAGPLNPVLPEDQRWLIENLPTGSVVQSQDVGVFSHLPGITVVDSDGLVDARFAGGRGSSGTAWVADWYASDDRPTAIRTAAWRPEWTAAEPPEGLDPWLRVAEGEWAAHYEQAALYRTGRDGWHSWIRMDRHDDARPTPDEVARRWQLLADRFPSQPWYQQRRQQRGRQRRQQRGRVHPQDP